MGPHDIRELLRARPFVPFRLHTSEGKSYEVRHPDGALVLATRVMLPADTKNGEEFAERSEHVALAHIVRAEELSTESKKA